MYRFSVVKSLFKSSTAPALLLGKPALTAKPPFYPTNLMDTGGTHGQLMTSLLKSRRSYSSTTTQQPATPTREALPDLLLPGPVKYIERSTPLITKSELENYFYPLFCRGWEIKRLPEDNVNSSDPIHASPFLVHKFRFKGNRTSRAFLQEVLRTESEEKHHTSFKLWSEKQPVITVMTQTHSARRFNQTTESPVGGVEPGLTLRDIRIAVLLENLLDIPNNLIARVPDPEEHRSTDRNVAWQNLLSQYPFTN